MFLSRRNSVTDYFSFYKSFGDAPEYTQRARARSRTLLDLHRSTSTSTNSQKVNGEGIKSDLMEFTDGFGRGSVQRAELVSREAALGRLDLCKSV